MTSKATRRTGRTNGHTHPYDDTRGGNTGPGEDGEPRHAYVFDADRTGPAGDDDHTHSLPGFADEERARHPKKPRKETDVEEQDATGATETLAFDAMFEIKAGNEADDEEERGVFEGLASTFGNKDRGGDIVMPGAFAKAVRGGPQKIKLLFAHDTREPIGVLTELEETLRGLRIKGRLLINQGVPTADKVFALMKAKALDALSIGFFADPKKQEFDSDKGIRLLKNIELFEVSVVTFGMNPKARIQRVKALGVEDIQTKADLEIVLRDAGVSRQAAKYVAAHWNPPAQRDVEGEVKELVDAMTRVADTLTG